MTRKRWPSASRVCPSGVAAVEEALACRAVDDRDESRLGDVGRAERAAFEELELEDAPELVVGSLELRLTLLCRRGTSARCDRVLIQRQPLDAGQVAGVACRTA